MSNIVESLYRVTEAYDTRMYDEKNRKRFRELCQMFNVTSIDIEKALNFQYGLDRDLDLSTYTDQEVEKALDYFFDKGSHVDWT